MKLIGLAGAPRVGKDTIADYLEERYGYTVTAFAMPLKMAVQNLFGLNCTQAFNDTVKEVPVQPWGLTPREMWCDTADAIKDKFGADFFIKRWQAEIVGEEYVVVSDVRFEGEAELVRAMGGTIIHVSRHQAPPLVGRIAKHNSNDGISYKDGDFAILNNGTLDDLMDSVDDLMGMLSD